MAWFRFRSRKSAVESARQPSAAPLDLELDDSAASDPTWLDSTRELRTGLTVIEHPIDTLPGELREALATARRAAKRRP